MAYVQFTVFDGASTTADGDPIQEGIITIDVTSTQGAVLTPDNKKRRRVRVKAVGADACVEWGANPTASADGTAGRHMGDGNPEYFNIEAGHRLACIQAA